MKKKVTTLLSFFFLQIYTQNTQVLTFISPRSQGFNTALLLAGLDKVIQVAKQEKFYSTYAVSLEASTTFRPERINQCLFGQDIVRRDKNSTEWKDFLIISGSQTENRIPQKDWLADYFGLPTDFKSIVRFRPRVNNTTAQLQAFFGFNATKKGLYTALSLPIVYTNWDLNIQEMIQNEGSNNYIPGYFNATGVDRDNLLTDFSSYISGAAVPRINNAFFHSLQHGKMKLNSQRAIHFAELRATVGYDHFIQDMHRIGLKMQLAAPFGNRPEADYLFEPIIGNQRHWELGVGITAHALAWENDTADEQIDLFLDALINHLFRSHQRRSFDLKQKPNSRYMLAQKMHRTITDNLTGNGITPIGQFDNEFTPIINLTTYDIDVLINCQADVTFMCSYTKKSNYWSFGYSAWKRGCEDITIKDKKPFPEMSWAIKGDAQLFGFIGTQTNPEDLPIGTPVPLSATEQIKATINYGANLPKQGISSDETIRNEQIADAKKNPRIDFPQPAFAGNNQYLVTSPTDTSQENQINTSIQPLFISFTDLDINSAASSGFSHKIFTHFNHVITTYGNAEAFIGFGAEVEFGRQAGPPPVIGDDKCINCALSFWGVWLKGGASW